MTIDLNCDVGEGMQNEHLLMPFISSCNIACGGHYGNSNTIDKAVQLAIENKVYIGAHPSFPDKKKFGRTFLNLSKVELADSLRSQLDLFCNILDKKAVNLHHIKPHGALYNAIAKDEYLANIFIEITKPYLHNKCYLYVPFGSKIEKVAYENRVSIKYEAFADRRYNLDLSLVSRNNKNAVITELHKVIQQVFLMVDKQLVTTILGEKIHIKAETFCIHSDTKNAVNLVQELHKELEFKGVTIDKTTYL